MRGLLLQPVCGPAETEVLECVHRSGALRFPWIDRDGLAEREWLGASFISCRSTLQEQFTCPCALLLLTVLRGHGFGFKLLRLVMGDERVDEWVEVAFHHEIQLVNRQADTVIADSVFFEVVSTNLF